MEHTQSLTVTREQEVLLARTGNAKVNKTSQQSVLHTLRNTNMSLLRNDTVTVNNSQTSKQHRIHTVTHALEDVLTNTDLVTTDAGRGNAQVHQIQTRGGASAGLLDENVVNASRYIGGVHIKTTMKGVQNAPPQRLRGHAGRGSLTEVGHVRTSTLTLNTKTSKTDADIGDKRLNLRTLSKSLKRVDARRTDRNVAIASTQIGDLVKNKASHRQISIEKLKKVGVVHIITVALKTGVLKEKTELTAVTGNNRRTTEGRTVALTDRRGRSKSARLKINKRKNHGEKERGRQETRRRWREREE
jgi:hypothetical protein